MDPAVHSDASSAIFSSDRIAVPQCLSGDVLHNSLLHLLLKHRDFLNTDISQGSVATRLVCGGVFKCDFVQGEWGA